MYRSIWQRVALSTALVGIVLSGTLLGAQPTLTRASRPGVDMNVTLSVYTVGGSLQGFNDTDPTHIFSIHNVYAKLWARMFPHLKWKETLVSDAAALQTKLTLAVNAGNPPDLVFMFGGYPGFSVLRRLIQPLDKYYAQYHISDSYFLPSMARWAHFGGHWWAIPASSGPYTGQSLYVPKYMAPLGYNNSNLRTFDDYYQMSKKAVRFDSSGNLTRIGYWPGTTVWGAIPMCPPSRGLYDKNNQPTATDSCVVSWLSYLKKLVDLYGGYTKLNRFLSGNPDIWSGSPKDYMATGKALIPPSATAWWSVTAFDTFPFGIKGGLQYALTPLPPTVHGTVAEAANYIVPQQEIVIPRGAKHPDAAFRAIKTTVWDYGYLLGPTSDGSPVAADQERWLNAFIVGEAAARKHAGLRGNPVASMKGIKKLPALARMSRAPYPTNPVDVYYEEQLGKATARVLYGQQTPQAALQQVQQLVLADEQRLKAQYGSWTW